LPDDNSIYYFAGIDSARFKRPVEPGDQMMLDVVLDRMKSSIFKFTAKASVGGELAVEASLICAVRNVA
jgi:3-hydroxyacyl-[acyl-carrier-protein] dehydratase